MVDFQTQFRLHGYKYNAPEVTQPQSTYRDLYRESGPHLFKTPRVEVHDCRPDSVRALSDQPLWEAQLYSHGLRKTADHVVHMHQKQTTKTKDGHSPPDKLLYTVGRRGTHKQEFQYPRSLAVTGDGDIYVADTHNHRLQAFNQCGVFLRAFGSQGDWNGEFDEPTGVAVLPNGHIAVAERKNHRIQVVDEEGEHKSDFTTVDPPYHIACDENYHIVVSTVVGSIEVYRRQNKLQYRFSLPNPDDKPPSKFCPRPIAVNDKNEVIVCDTVRNMISFYKYSGQLLYEFQPVCIQDGLACQPSSVDLTPLGQLLVSDSLNHTINLYSERGVLLQQLVGPTDDAGALQAVKMGPEGHLVGLEYTSNGPHCLKIFRFTECECHRTLKGLTPRTESDKSTL